MPRAVGERTLEVEEGLWASIYDVRKIFGSPPCPNCMYYLSAKFGYFLAPLSADVIYGSSLEPLDLREERRAHGAR